MANVSKQDLIQYLVEGNSAEDLAELVLEFMSVEQKEALIDEVEAMNEGAPL